MLDRVCYFSKHDLSLAHYLEMAERRIHEVAEGDVPSDLSGIIELWHIKRMIENGCRLKKWTDEEYNEFKDSVGGYNDIIANFFNRLDPKMIKSEFELLDWPYKETFWKIIDNYGLYKLIEPETLHEILKEKIGCVRDILECKGMVKKFKDVIREILLNDANSAYIILDKYEVKQELNEKKELFLPSNLTLDDKEQILVNYLQSEEPNLNYVRLITQIKDDKKEIMLSPKTRLLAERLAQKLNDDLMSNPKAFTTHWLEGVQFIDKEEIKPADFKFDKDGNLIYTYSIPYVRNCDNRKRVGNCISLFGWLNEHFLLDLINKITETNPIELFLIDKGQHSYPSYTDFMNRNNLAIHQLCAYEEVLKKIDSSFEFELKQFYEHYLKEAYCYPSLPINFPNINDFSLNKCRVLCPELDSIAKQYNIFIETDEIDTDLIRFSKPLKIEDVKSLLPSKYYEIAENNNEILTVLRDLFGSFNSLLYYVKPFEDKNYSSLVELLEKENNVLYSNYEDFQKPHLDFLIKHGFIDVNPDGHLYIVNPSAINVLKSLWEYGVCSYWHYNEAERKILDEMLKKEWLVTDDHLLSKPERDYFSYYLDNRTFTNGPAYRNHYSHGSTPPVDDENEHFIAYLTFLRLLAILLLKIEDDLFLARRLFAIELENWRN